MKKTVLLTEMFMDVATASEKKKFEMLYASRNKGSATVFALRTIKVYWDLYIAKKDKPSTLPDNSERTIKITYNSVSAYEKF